MSPADPLEKQLCLLAATSEELLRLLERRDPRFLESLEKRQQLLGELSHLLARPGRSPLARATLERIRQLGEACQREALAMRREAEQALAALDRDLAYAESLRRLDGPLQTPLVDLRG